MVKYLFSLCILVFLNSANPLQAQSLSDLDGKTWKDNTTSIDVLAQAMEDADAAARVDQLATSAIVATKFKMTFILQVSLRLADRKSVPDALWEGYQESVNGLDQKTIDPADQAAVFTDVVGLLQK
jgi:hypothetical protein